MANIATAIRLNDQMTAPIRNISNAMNMMLSSWTRLEDATASGLNTDNVQEIRTELHRAVSAMDDLEQEARQAAQAVDGAERQQEQFNQDINAGTRAMDSLGDTIMGAIGAYAGIQSLGKLVNLSDTFVQTQARLDMINDGSQTTAELFDKITTSADRSRASIQRTADTVAKLSLNAGDAFSNNDEAILFAENLNKLFAISGTNVASMESATLQLTQALGSGVLRGEELNAVFEAAPMVIQTVADYMNVPIGQIRKMASEGKLSADVVKYALLSATDQINAKFQSMPMTWSQVWTQITNAAYYASIPLLNVINWLAQNWQSLAPIVAGVAIAIGLYTAALLIHKAVTMGAALAESVRAASTAMSTGATFAATAAQHGFNAALLACPITWIILTIIALIAILFAVCAHIANTGETATTAFGVMTGGINVVIQWFKNLGLMVANIAVGIGKAIGAVATNIGVAFGNAISGVQGWFYGLLSTAINVVAGICEALNKLPFVEFDYSGIVAKADEYAAKSAAAAGNKGEYVSIADAFNEGMNTYDAFSDGWAADAYAAGAAWGDNVSNKIGEKFGGSSLGEEYSLDSLMGIDGTGGATEYPVYDQIDAIESNTAGGGGAAKEINDKLDVTNDTLKYLRDLAEQEAVNRFTTAEIKVDMGGVQNVVNSNMDLDGVIDYMVTGVKEAMESVAEGVHV